MHEGPPPPLSAPARATRTALEGPWEVLVVGAGPAGGLAARELARRGLATLLVERERWPRTKVCGSYVNGRAASVLTAAGLGALLDQEGAVPVRELVLHAGGAPARLPLPGRGRLLSRARLDGALVRAALEAGATFSPGTRARLAAAGADGCEVDLQREDGVVRARARIVLLADGLAGGADPAARTATAVAPGSRIGLGALLQEPGDVPPGRIRMACGRDGYVGAARLEDGRLCVAAAVDGAALEGDPGRVVARVLEEAGLEPGVELRGAAWKGTPPLTRFVRDVSGPRTLRVGDASGYVEPFTGEGIAWALEGALRVAPLAALAARGDAHAMAEAARRWERAHRETVGARRGAARTLAALLRHPRATRAAVGALARAPRLGALGLRPLLTGLDRPLGPLPADHIV